ncbi:MAG: CDP-diacylglycerol--serine O-phosphatidyltransferase [Candidatus Hydrogenedentota bacterium]
MSGFRVRKKRNRRRRRSKRRPINVLASALTTAGLCAGIGSMFAALNDEFARASYLIIIAIVFDMLDGPVAKLTKSVSEFGKQLDSLCDLVSFGAAPAVLVYSVYVEEAGAPTALLARAGSVMAIVFPVCGALRLARFTLYQTEKRDYFVGLPIPAAGGTLASYVLFVHYFEVRPLFWIAVLGPMSVGLAFLMVSTALYPKDRIKTVILAPRYGFRLLLVTAVTIAVFISVSDESPAVILFPVLFAYVLLGLYGVAKGYFERRGSRLAENGAESASTTPLHHSQDSQPDRSEAEPTSEHSPQSQEDSGPGE